MKWHGDWQCHSRGKKEGCKRSFERPAFSRFQWIRASVWAEPGVDWSKLSISIDAEAIVRKMQPELVQALSHALGKFAKTGAKHQ